MADEEKNEEKNEEKKAKKERKRKNDTPDQYEEEMEEKPTIGSRLAVVFVTLIIIAVWMGIFALLIKLDVGGVGSGVLQPLIEDVPVLNKILPGEEEEPQGQEDSEEAELYAESEYPYSSLGEAIDQIKVMELEIEQLQKAAEDKQTQINTLKSENDRLKHFESDLAEFEKQKKEFYENVIYSENSPDISQYQSYYEMIDPENAAELYKQVVEQEQKDERIQKYVETYSSMKAKSAAAIFEGMSDNIDLVVDILAAMDVETRADILGAMNTDFAAKLTVKLAPDEIIQ